MNRFAAALFLATGIFQTAGTAALVAYYPLNETSGNVANDASGNARHATSTVAGGNNNWQSGGIIGGAVQFTPTAQADMDEAFVHASGANITTSYPFSMSTWFRTSSSSAFNQTMMNFSGNTTANSRYYSILMSSATGNPLAGQARNNTSNFTANSGIVVNGGQWHQAVWVLSADNARTLYLDGVAVITDAQTVAPLPAADNPRKLGIGGLMRSSNTASYTDAFSGLLDDAGFWTDSLTATDVALMHAFGRYDGVALNQSAIFANAMNVFNTQSGTVDTGALDWAYATGLTGGVGSSGVSGGNPYVVLDASGNGLAAIPEASAAVLAALAALSLTGRRRRAASSPLFNRYDPA